MTSRKQPGFARKVFSLLAFAVFSLVCSCAAEIEARVEKDGRAEVGFGTALKPEVNNFLRRLSANFGLPFVMDGEAMGRSMSSAPGISGIHLRNETPSALKGTFSLSRVDAFLSRPGMTGAGRFITYSQDDKGGSLVISLDLERAPELVALFSEDVRHYLAAVMAPAESGIAQTKEEYLEGVAVMYGAALADEISGARIKLALTVPGAIQRIKGGTFSQNRAEFDIPLVDFLVLDKELLYEIGWSK